MMMIMMMLYVNAQSKTSKWVSDSVYIRRQNGRVTPQRRRVALKTVQTDASSVAAETCPLTGSCHAAVTQTDPHFGLVEGEAALTSAFCTLGRSTHLVDADCSRGRPWTFFTGTHNSCRYGGATPLMHFHTRTALLKMILRRTGSQWRLRRTGVIWSLRRAPDSRRAAVFCTNRFI